MNCAAPQTHRQRDYAPQQAKTFAQRLTQFIHSEFPRFGGPWIVDQFVTKVLALLEEHAWWRDRLQPGQMIWLAVAAEERPRYHKSMAQHRQVPVVLTIVHPDDIQQLKQGQSYDHVKQQAIARATKEAYQQGGVLSQIDLSLLFSCSPSAIARKISSYQAQSGDVLPFRGTLHDLGMTLTHKRQICYKAFVEGKPTPQIALETSHSAQAVDRYLLDFGRVYLAVCKRDLSMEETAFTMGCRVRLVKAYLDLIRTFGLTEDQVTVRMKEEDAQ